MNSGKFLAALTLAAVVGCSTTGPVKTVDPVLREASVDPNPYADYAVAMASNPELPMAVEWHNLNAESLAKATEVEALKQFVMLPKNADDLLAQVKPAYETDPMVSIRIAAVSQLVMCPKWDKAPAAREIWTCALIGAAEKASDDYRRMFFLDQLRWCGKAAQVDRVLQIAGKVDSKAVNDFAAMVVKEMKGAR